MKLFQQLSNFDKSRKWNLKQILIESFAVNVGIYKIHTEVFKIIDDGKNVNLSLTRWTRICSSISL